MNVQIFKDNHWQNSDGSLMTVAQLQEIADGLQKDAEGQSGFHYSHDEIERSCGGVVAMNVRRKVLARRQRIAEEDESA